MKDLSKEILNVMIRKLIDKLYWRFHNEGRGKGFCLLKKLIEKQYWYYQEIDNWEMKMNEPIAIKVLTEEEVQEVLAERSRKLHAGEYEVARDEEVLEISSQLMSQNKEAYEVLAQ